jgi:uncharacterized membrane protein
MKLKKEQIPKSEETEKIEKSIEEVKLLLQKNEDLGKDLQIGMEEIIKKAKELNLSDVEIENLMGENKEKEEKVEMVEVVQQDNTKKRKLTGQEKEDAEVVPFVEVSKEKSKEKGGNNKEAEKGLKTEQQENKLKEQKSSVEKAVEETREKYIQEYKKCKNESDRHNLIIKTKNSIFNIFKSSEKKTPVRVEDFYTDRLKEEKKEYDQARIELGNTMYSEKKVELEKSGLSGDELEKALINYKATKIIAKTIIEERQKIIDSRVKDPSKFNKLIDGYRRMPKWQRVALSTALFTAAAGVGVVSGGVFAGYGLATMAAMKFGASMTMGALTTYSVKGIDLMKKKSDLKFTENQSNIKTILKDQFATNEITQEKYEKQMELLESEEKKRARNRILLKAGVGIAIAGIAGHFAYDTLGNGLSHTDHINNLHDIKNIRVDRVTGADVNHNIHESIIKPTNITEKIVEHQNIEAVADHGQGAISTIHELQDKLKLEYGNDLDNAPESIKHILNTDAHKLAQEYGMYKPEEDAESVVIHSGDSFKVDEHGNVSYHDVNGKDIILEKGTEIKASTMYEGKMSDTDHSGSQIDQVNQESINPNTVEDTTPVNSSEVTNDKYALHPLEIKNIDQVELAHATHNLRGEILLNKSGDEIITTAPLAGLSTEDLHQVYLTFHDNIKHLFPTSKLMGAWDSIKKNIPADRLMELHTEGQMKPEFGPLIEHINKLEKITGFKPIPENELTGTPAESITHFMNRAMEKIQLEGKINEIKL